MGPRAVCLAVLFLIACTQQVSDALRSAAALEGRQTVEFELGKVP
jgi:hypothetical protein